MKESERTGLIRILGPIRAVGFIEGVSVTTGTARFIDSVLTKLTFIAWLAGPVDVAKWDLIGTDIVGIA